MEFKIEVEIKKIGELIEKEKKIKKITNSELSKKIGVSKQAVSKVISNLKKGKSCNLKTLLKIIIELDLKINLIK